MRCRSWSGQNYGRGYGGEERSFWDRASDEVSSWFGDEEAARRRQQDQRGRGPRNYTRSGDRIREDVNDRLTDDWRVDASDIEVTTSGTEVTLAGTVPNRDQRRRAEDIAESVSGAREFRLVRVHHEDGEELRRLGPAGIRADGVTVPRQLREALSGLIGLQWSVVDLARDSRLQARSRR